MVCAEYSHGTYLVVNKNPFPLKIDNIQIPCFSLESEREAYTRLSMQDKAKIIANFSKKINNLYVLHFIYLLPACVFYFNKRHLIS